MRLSLSDWNLKHAIDEICATLRDRRFAVLTGAGISTESGIPDYRGPETKHVERNPITFQQFISDREFRRRYWARARFGWSKMRTAEPNAAHFALVDLERRGLVTAVITQNVDQLHGKAGSQNVIELHGTLGEAICLSCREVTPRADLQRALETLNPTQEAPTEFAPDGDSVVASDAIARFNLPTCETCGGDYKPNVVFFGENVVPEVRDAAFEAVDDAEALLVVGTSLQVYSGLRYVKHAAKSHKPIFAINLGPTRGDDLIWAQDDRVATESLTELASRI